MPYIKEDRRDEIEKEIGKNLLQISFPISNAGELNYLITRIIQGYLLYKGDTSYGKINEVIGVLECCKLELYRRLAAPYEDEKIIENGDVY